MTSDKVIFDMVKSCHTTFTHSQFPLQLRTSQSIKFADWETSLMDLEINKLLQKGVIEEAIHSHGEFLFNVFLRPKKHGSFRMILNHKNLNLHVEYNLMKPCYAHLWCQGHLVSQWLY